MGKASISNKYKKNLKLTISLMVSNSITTIRKCMESIVPILKNIPSELIVVDTGGTDGSIKIAKEYADMVISFSWCNDFAKARNVGLERASGEWFLFLDDDEWFEDTKEIIDFFKTEEYRKYECASYEIRNYLNKEGTEWNSTRYYRMIKIRPETKFISPIHEILDPIYSPEKEFECYVHHYGYIFENEEDKKRHGNRNISILKAVLKEKPNDIRLQVQLAKELAAIGEFEESFNVSSENLRNIEKCEDKSSEQVLVAGWHINNILHIKIIKDDEEEVYEKAKEFFQYRWLNIVTKNNILYILANMAYLLGKYKDCCDYTLEYDETYKLILENSKTKIGEVIAEQCKSYNEESCIKTMMNGLKSAYQCEKEDIQIFILNRLEKYKFKIMDKEDIKCIIMSVLEVHDKLNIVGYIKKIPLQQWESNVDEFLKSISWEVLIKLQEVLDTYKEYEIRLLTLKIKCYENIFRKNEIGDLDYDYMNKLLRYYVDVVIKFNLLLYKEDIFTTEMEIVLPDNCRFCNKLQMIYEEDIDDLSKAKIIREAVDLYPPLASFCKIYLHKMQEETKKANDEFLQLGEMIKKSIRTYITMGQLENAKLTLTQLEQLLPHDSEILELKKMLE